jgi:hypothetical protein
MRAHLLFDTRSDRFLTPVLTGFSKGHNGHLMSHSQTQKPLRPQVAFGKAPAPALRN